MAVLATGAEPTRVVQWNVTPGMVAFMYASMVVALGIFGYTLALEVRRWRRGRPTPRWNDLGRRLRFALVNGAGAALMYGLIVLFLATVVVFADHDLGIRVMRGWFYLIFQSLIVDLFGLAALAGITFTLIRRLANHARGRRPARVADLAFLTGILILILSGFTLEGLRIEATHDPWAAWSPGGLAVGAILAALLPASALAPLHAGLWVAHVGLWHTLLALVLLTTVRHASTVGANLLLSNPAPASPLPALDFEAEEVPMGIRHVGDMTWKQLLDLSTCTECGRCTDACPAFRAGKPLSPRDVIVGLRDHVRAHPHPEPEAPPLAGSVIGAETLWSCTSCRACEEACPVGIEHVGLILQLRQNLAMEQGSVPAGVSDMVQSLEDRQHPFRGAAFDRSSWYQGLPVRELGDGDAGELEVVYWVGCAVVSNPRVQDVARATARAMLAAGVRFAVLGPREVCTGDPARRTGNEFHYDQLARQNIALLEGAGVRRLVTHCPHCLQTLLNDYRQLGLALEVVHHTEFLGQLVASGRLRPERGLDEDVTYHDPCYLGRHNRVFGAPRDLLDRIGARRLEMAESGTTSMCCGAGGGHAFFQDPSGEKVNRIRARQALDTGAATICTACPFCLPMLEDGVAGQGEARVRDIAELLVESLEPGQGGPGA